MRFRWFIALASNKLSVRADHTIGGECQVRLFRLLPKSRSTWRLVWVPAHLFSAPLSVSVLPSYHCSRIRGKKDRITGTKLNCITCVTAFHAPTRAESLYGAAFIMCVHGETGNSLLGSTLFIFFLGPKHIVKHLNRHSKPVHEATAA